MSLKVFALLMSKGSTRDKANALFDTCHCKTNHGVEEGEHL